MATRDSLIQVTDLKKWYKGGAIKALDGVTVDINKGDVIAVIGPSGSGKSTFLRSLNLLEEPTGGAILFNGVDLTKKKYKNNEGKTVKLDVDSLRQKMGMVFQHFNLFPHMTILENMILAPMKVKNISRAEAEEKSSGPFGPCWTEGSGRRLSDSAVRRPEAASSHCPCSGYGAGGYAV